jgi:multidrug efflux pump subunit AcrB
MAGQIAEQKGTFLSLGLALLSSLFLVYMVLSIQFRSFLDPFIIMFTVPLGLIGVIWMFFLTGTNFSSIAFMGVIVTGGIAVSNGVLLVDYTNKLVREKGRDLKEAVVLGGRTRLRPVLMTSIATITGLMPMAIGLEVGSSNSMPLARAVIGGLSFSTVFTLVLIPLVYVSLHEWREKRRSKGTTFPTPAEWATVAPANED